MKLGDQKKVKYLNNNKFDLIQIIKFLYCSSAFLR